MKRQQLEKLKGKKLTGGYGGGKRQGGGQAQGQPAGADKEGKVPMAVRLIQGLGRK